MALSPSDIDRIAHLARIDLSANERARMLVQLNDFFGIVETMQSVDTSGIEPLTHPVAAIENITLRLREDAATEPDNRDANMHNAPAADKGLFLVPRVIE